MVKTVFSKVAWVGRVTVFMVGLAVILAVLFGVATAALGTTGGNFILGNANNTAETPTGLVGTLADEAKTALMVQNKSGGPALDLRVGNPSMPANNVPPMRVNSRKVVANLNSDRLDGKDSSEFMPLSIYGVGSGIVQGQPNTYSEAWAKCDPGDEAISGSYLLDPLKGYDPIRKSWIARGPLLNPDYYIIGWHSDASPTDGQVSVTCIDLGTPH